MENLKAVLEEAGSSFENVLKLLVIYQIWIILLHLMKFMHNISKIAPATQDLQLQLKLYQKNVLVEVDDYCI